ncbi:MAG: hypothetical protein HC923_10725 [Myxococcales bacterium]|nr:hypothetical protein [Myxococcales bacterium]
MERGVFTVSNRGLELAVHRLGIEQGTPVLALHGFLDHGESFASVAALLAPDTTIYAPDARGHGASGWVGAAPTITSMIISMT